MTTYKGPHVAVTQKFVPTPGAVAVESLPPTIVATAFDVFRNQNIGSSFGIINTKTVPWGADKVVFNKDVINQRALEMFPPQAFADSAFGKIDLAINADNTLEGGVEIGRDDSYSLPDVANASGTSQATIPFYDKTADVNLYAEDKSTIIITGGDVITAGLRPGQSVFIYDGASWLSVGTVGSIGSDKTKIKLSAAYSAAVIGERIVVGSASVSLIDRPNTFYDPNADFILRKVRVGDILEFSSLSITDSLTTPIQATVTSVLNKNTLKFNTENLNAVANGNVDSDFTKYMFSDEEPGATIRIDAYDIKRLIGFSENHQLKLLNAGAGVPVVLVGPTTFTANTGSVALSQGDVFSLTPTNPTATSEERDNTNLRTYRVVTISYAGSVATVTTDSEIFQSVSGQVAYEDGDFLTAWAPKIETDILANFRAVRVEEKGVVKRIASTQDIFDAWVRSEEEAIDPMNELAFMMNIAFGNAGGNVCYGVNVDATSAGLAGEYADALDELKLTDCYSHAFGSTDGGVNALMAPYCLDEAEPYHGHEKIGIVCYDERDVFLMGVDGGDCTSAGVITLDGAVNLLTAGVTVKDQVLVYDEDGIQVDTLTVTATPSSANVVQTNGTVAYTDHTFRFLSGRKDDQAVKIGALGLGERRVAVLWPGYFTAVVNNETLTLPPYYLAAAIIGMDSSLIASQSFTNYTFSVPGLSNIQLGTNSVYRKEQLDEMAGGGVDVLIQDTPISQSVKSRHDLTSNMDAVVHRERSIVKQADVCAKTLRSGTAPYVGKYNINDDLLRFLGEVCASICSKLIRDGVVQSISVTGIERDEVIDDKINFYVEATVFVAGNYYDITLLVKTR